VSEGFGTSNVWMGEVPVEPYPFEETTSVRSGPDVHPALLGLLPLLGVWRGRGQGGYPSLEADFFYAQELRFSHDGRPFLHYESRAWLIEEDGTPIKASGREIGWWRPVVLDGRATDDVEVLLTHPTGFMELYVGTVSGTKIEIATDAVVRTATAKEVTAGHRLYGIVDGALLYAYEMAGVGLGLTPHLSARLERVS
jgi:hypothetical protein